MDLERLLAEGKVIQIKPEGYSMYPLLVPGRDKVLIEQISTERLRRGDVVLYRRKSGILVLHRIWKHDSKGFYMVGDNQTRIEGPLKPQQIKGKMTGIIRNGRQISAEDWRYRLVSGLWLWLRPARPYISKTAAWVKGAVKSKKR